MSVSILERFYLTFGPNHARTKEKETTKGKSLQIVKADPRSVYCCLFPTVAVTTTPFIYNLVSQGQDREEDNENLSNCFTPPLSVQN